LATIQANWPENCLKSVMENFTTIIRAYWQKCPTLGQSLREPGNLFTPMRMFFALGVLLGHSYVVNYGTDRPEPLSLFQMTISYVAVNGFFILSGLLITRSIDRNPDFIRFFSARALRLFPAIALMAFLASFVIGPLVSAMPPQAYFSDPMIWRYIVDVMTFGDTSGGPPQIFSNNPAPFEWSASLWTLRYEAIAYVGTAILAAVGISRSRTAMLALFVLSVSLFLFVRLEFIHLPDLVLHLTRFATTYLLGAVLYCYRNQVRLSWLLGAGLVAVALLFGPVMAPFEIMINFVLAAVLLLIGFAKIPGRKMISKMPDASYGVYIWQWPVMQILWHFDIARDPFSTMFIAIPITIAVGLLSWYGLEKPVLALKDPVANWLRNKLKSGKTA